MKYIIFETPGGLQTVRIFDEITSHFEVAQEVASRSPGLKIVSAGKVFLKARRTLCRSGAVTLGMKFDLAQSQTDEKDIVRLSQICV